MRDLVDALFRLAYRLAYRAARLYWRAVHPTTHGALVAVWHGGEILLVQNSYVPYRSLPGGYVRRRESGRAAAVRELAEELGLRVDEAELAPAVEVRHEWEGKRDWVEIFELEPGERPRVEVDRREVVEARFFSPAEALAQDLFPPVRAVVERRMTAAGAVGPLPGRD